MESGNIVEYIDRQKIICAVVQQVKQKRLRLLAENNREVNLSITRVCHHSSNQLDPELRRDEIVSLLKQIAAHRRHLTRQIDIEKLWEIVNSEQEWIDLPTMTGLCFPESPDSDHESAVVRAFFEDRLYFKFGHDCFFPHTKSQVEQIEFRRYEDERKNRLIDEGTAWVQKTSATEEPLTIESMSIDQKTIVTILKRYYLFGKDSNESDIAKSILKNAEIDSDNGLFDFLVRMGVFDKDENIELLRHDIPIEFPTNVQEKAQALMSMPPADHSVHRRVDLTGLSPMTIDGPATLDFDDAVTLEPQGQNFRIGIHITDVAHYVKRGDPIDTDAMRRGTSIYMPDQKISMLYPGLSEELCSLKAGAVRPAISTLVDMDAQGKILDYQVVPSLIRVASQLFYRDVNLSIDTSPSLISLCELAKQFRLQRFEANAVHISLPEIHLWLDEEGDIHLNRLDRESPARMMVSELMILANSVTARFLSEHNMPGIFRSQAEPQKRLYQGLEENLFQNWMQRRHLSRFMLSHTAEKHVGLGVDSYVTGTSPIRKYSDLVCQRQIRAILGMEEPYSAEEIDHIIATMQTPLAQVGQIQRKRNRYWLLKYLEKMIGEKTEAHVLFKRRSNYQLLLPEYMIECTLPHSDSIALVPEDIIEVTFLYVNARTNRLSIAMA